MKSASFFWEARKLSHKFSGPSDYFLSQFSELSTAISNRLKMGARADQ
jgi:hypothetical protein